MADAGGERPAATPGSDAREDRSEAFLSRWSRLKREARETPAAPAQPAVDAPDAESPPPELPPLENLTFDSDYRQFLDPRVGEEVRRTALKKLFSDPRFNVMDGLDVYIDDYSRTEPIPAAMLAGLKQAQNIFQWARGEGSPDAEEAAPGEPVQAAQPQTAHLESSAVQPPAAGVADPDPGEPQASRNSAGADRGTAGS